MSHSDWIEQVRKLRDHVDEYITFLEAVDENEAKASA